MKQLLQNLKTGVLTLAELPVPELKRGHVLIRGTRSLVSIGTERMLLDFGRAGWIDKVRKQPDKVKQVLAKIKTDGFIKTWDTVQNKLDSPIALGYSHVGVVCGVGEGVADLKLGDRVVSNGPHAEMVMCPKHLVSKLPDSVSDDQAVFSVTGAIALQGVRLLAPQLGETVAVIGLGLLGLITVQLLRANGCRVLGVDFDEKKLALAASWGAQTVHLSVGDDPVAAAMKMTGDRGVDGVLICASTASSEPLHTAASMSRQRGRVVLVGVIGGEWSRDDFYKKELQLQVSCSYGPGRYDPIYEGQGMDYPYAYVRWTEHRNLGAIVELLAQGKLDFSAFLDQRVAFDQAIAAYEQVLHDRSLIGLVFDYPCDEKIMQKRQVTIKHSLLPMGHLGIGFIGAGNYTKSVLLPALSRVIKGKKASLVGIASQSGVSAQHLGKKYGFLTQYSHGADLLADDRVNVVFITTRHDTHARWVCDAIRAGKHVFVEKPLCLTRSEQDEIEGCLKARPDIQILVGFNRRFSPHIQKIKTSIGAGPMTMTLLMNAGAIPNDHWTQGDSGGGRLIGEAVHYVDLARYLAGSAIAETRCETMGGQSDVASVVLKFENGSIATLHYWANGHGQYSKEKITVFSSGRVIEMDNFRKTMGYGTKGWSSYKTLGQDKGQTDMLDAWINALIDGENPPIPVDEILEVSRVSIANF